MSESSAAGFITTSQLENYYLWAEPDSDITVCLRLATMDRLQHAVLHGLSSVSQAGREVGGILLGRTERVEGRTLIFVDAIEPVACEHRNGPAYVLTSRDEVAFQTALARFRARAALSTVGYYRSHNREGLFLSADDFRLIQRHFRGPENVFLLVKTLTNSACTAGFFFWRDGELHTEFTDSEAPLIPIALASPGRDKSSSNIVDDGPSGSLLPPAQELPPVMARAGSPRRNLLGMLWFDLLIGGFAAAVTFAALLYWEKRPAQDTPHAVASNGAETTAALLVPVEVPASVAKEAASPIPKPSATPPGEVPSVPAPEVEPKRLSAAPVPEAPAGRAGHVGAQSGPPLSKPATTNLEMPPVTEPPGAGDQITLPALALPPPVLGEAGPARRRNAAERHHQSRCAARSKCRTTHSYRSPNDTHVCRSSCHS